MRLGSEEDSAFIIHRPFGFGSAQEDLLTASQKWRTLQTDIHQYFLEMNIPTALFDAIIEVPSDTGRKLSPAELSRYLIVVNDPAFVEIQDAKETQKLGISRIEYLTRKRQFDECAAETNTNNYCMPQRCGIATDKQTMEFCRDYVTGPRAQTNLYETRRHNRQLGWYVTKQWEVFKIEPEVEK